MPYGYALPYGYMGLVGSGEYILFPTEREYYEYLSERPANKSQEVK